MSAIWNKLATYIFAVTFMCLVGLGGFLVEARTETEGQMITRLAQSQLPIATVCADQGDALEQPQSLQGGGRVCAGVGVGDVWPLLPSQYYWVIGGSESRPWSYGVAQYRCKVLAITCTSAGCSPYAHNPCGAWNNPLYRHFLPLSLAGIVMVVVMVLVYKGIQHRFLSSTKTVGNEHYKVWTLAVLVLFGIVLYVAMVLTGLAVMSG